MLVWALTGLSILHFLGTHTYLRSFPSHCFHLIDPAMIHVNRVSYDWGFSLIQHVLHRSMKHLSQYIEVTMSETGNHCNAFKTVHDTGEVKYSCCHGNNSRHSSRHVTGPSPKFSFYTWYHAGMQLGYHN